MIIPIAQMHFECASKFAEQFINNVLECKELENETKSPEEIFKFLWELYGQDPFDSMTLNALLALSAKVIWARKRCESAQPTSFSA